MDAIFYPQARVNVGLVPRATGELISLLALPARSTEVTHNDVYTADEFSLEVDGHHFPSDPRTVKCFAVDIHLADVGRAGKDLSTGSASTRSLVGHADKVSRRYRDQEMTFRAEGRDLTGLLLDARWYDRVVTLGRPLETIVREVLADVPSTTELLVSSDASFVVPGDVKSKKRNTYRAQQSTSVWEALTQLALRSGAVLVMDGDTLRIREPRTIDDATVAPLFIEGRNLSSLSIERELGTTDIPNIRVRAFDPATGKTVIGQWPKSPRKTVRATKSKKSTEISFQDHVIQHPAPTVALLTEVARRVHTHSAFQQLAAEFETKDLRALTHTGESVSLTGIRNGFAVRLRIDQETRHVLEREMSRFEKARALEIQGFERQVAQALAAGIRTIDTTLFVDRARHRYNVDNGYTLNVEAVNVLDVGGL